MQPQNTQTESGDGGFDVLTGRIIGRALTVLHGLGTGFLEKIYERALVHELRKAGLAVSQQHPMTIWYDGIVVGEYGLTPSSNTPSSLN
jgi:GxxExxY protein